MRKIRTGIIGIGKVTPLHVNALKDLPQSEFVAVASRNIDKAKNFTEKYGVKAYDDIEKMIKECKVEAVSICTPHSAHKEAAIIALNAGAHVIVEKPLASNLFDCDEMINTADKNKLILGMISQRRFYPSTQRVKKAIDEGKIGKPILGTVNVFSWRDEAYYKSDPWRGSWKKEGGGVLVNQTSHQLDILQWFMGSIDEVFGYWDNFNHPYIEVEDTAAAVVRFKNNSIGNIIVSNSQNPALYGKVHVYGSNGAAVGVQTDGGVMFVPGISGITEPPFNDIWTVPGEEKFLDKWKEEDTKLFNSVNPMDYFHERQFENFLNAIINGTKPLVTGKDGRITVELFTAIYRSQRDKKPVRFPLKTQNKNNFDGKK